MNVHKSLLLGGVLALVLFSPSNAIAAQPCCGITAIDARSGVITAKETATGRTFQFKLDDAALLGTVKVGQVVEADFKTMKVTVHPPGVSPCCAITGIDARTGVVTLKENTLKENTSARTPQITVSDTKLLSTLKVGQTVVANFTTGSVTVAPTGMIQK
jgi:Cu/Ag efflux protein CusF